MFHDNLSPLAAASRELVIGLSKGADPAEVERGCYELFTQNTNGLGSIDTRVVDVASQIVRGVLAAVVSLRSPAIAAATRGVSGTGIPGPEGDADRLMISERACRDIRDSAGASATDYDAALEGASYAARMSVSELRARLDDIPPASAHGSDSESDPDPDAEPDMVASS